MLHILRGDGNLYIYTNINSVTVQSVLFQMAIKLGLTKFSSCITLPRRIIVLVYTHCSTSLGTETYE